MSAADDGRSLTARAAPAGAAEPVPVSGKASIPIAELAERIEQAGGPSRELDREVELVVLPERVAPDPAVPLLAYTASLDAVMTLVPDEHRAGVLYHAMQTIQRTGFPNSTFLQRLILEVCAAALKARAQPERDNGPE